LSVVLESEKRVYIYSSASIPASGGILTFFWIIFSPTWSEVEEQGRSVAPLCHDIRDWRVLDFSGGRASYSVEKNYRFPPGVSGNRVSPELTSQRYGFIRKAND
jgi:hypothetical protein